MLPAQAVHITAPCHTNPHPQQLSRKISCADGCAGVNTAHTSSNSDGQSSSYRQSTFQCHVLCTIFQRTQHRTCTRSVINGARLGTACKPSPWRPTSQYTHNLPCCTPQSKKPAGLTSATQPATAAAAWAGRPALLVAGTTSRPATYKEAARSACVHNVCGELLQLLLPLAHATMAAPPSMR